MSAEDNTGLFMETCQKLWAACGDLPSWRSGYTDRLGKNLFYMLCNSDKFPGFVEHTAEACFHNYVQRRTYLLAIGVVTL